MWSNLAVCLHCKHRPKWAGLLMTLKETCSLRNEELGNKLWLLGVPFYGISKQINGHQRNWKGSLRFYVRRAVMTLQQIKVIADTCCSQCWSVEIRALCHPRFLLSPSPTTTTAPLQHPRVNKNLICRRPDSVFYQLPPLWWQPTQTQLHVMGRISTKMTHDVHYHNRAITCVFQISPLQM